MKADATWYILGFLIANAGCVAPQRPQPEITVDNNTTQVEGWFSARGEWTLFPTEKFTNYSPYNLEESKKCVSLINGTGSARSDFPALDGKKVTVAGKAVRYDDLSSGEGPSDRLLSKKYYKNEVVENFCLRDFVFVATNIALQE